MYTTYKELPRLSGQVEGYRCPVCGSPMYITHQYNDEITIHCAAPAAKFWEYVRGTLAETIARTHWDQSRRELVLGDRAGLSQG